ncbi:hypothetical protein POSPLADRAFT_1156967, partial [Postia placenta MAD-698-R-SB12]
GWGMQVPDEAGWDGTGVTWRDVDLKVPKGALSPLLSGSSQETSTCSWVSKVCSSREQSKNLSATVMGGGRGALGSFDLMSRLRVERQEKTKSWGRSTYLTKAMGQEVKTEVPRAAEAGLDTWGDKGRLCVLVCAQLVRAQHADAAPGASESERLCHELVRRLAVF